MTREEKIAEINKLCNATVCYSCNFTNICNRIANLAELSDDILDAMVRNGNKPNTGVLHIAVKEENKDDPNKTV